MPTSPPFKPGPAKTAQRRGRINTVERAAGRDVVGPIDGRNTGLGAHRTIQLIAERFGPRPDPVDILLIVGLLTKGLLQRASAKPQYVLRLRQRLATCAGAYFYSCAPLGPWQYAGAEVTVGEHRFDLVWQDDLERYWVDEIKTRRMAPRQRLRLETQAPAYVAVAREHWGPRFAGLRVCPVLTPYHAYTLNPDGERHDLVR